jgi:antitoxin component of MazEF toxin-antitoxin module
MVDKTILTKAASNSPSLRTTVPATIVKQFGLVDGDQLEWELQAQESKIVIIVKPIKL